MTYYDPETKERYLPYIIETSAGCDRTILTVMVDAYEEEEERVVMRFSPAIAPIKVAVFPLVKRDGMPEIARNIYLDLKVSFKAFYDESGAIAARSLWIAARGEDSPAEKDDTEERH